MGMTCSSPAWYEARLGKNWSSMWMPAMPAFSKERTVCIACTGSP